LLGVSGGIAAYKAVELARLLGKAGATVQVVMTEAATRFIGPPTFAAVTHKPVHIDLFEQADRILHVRLAREADVVAIAPATANVIAKMAHGIADDLVTNVALTARCPLLVAPAMHSEMWEHTATRENVATLRARGVAIVDPAVGELAGGDEGIGRLAEPEEIVGTLQAVLAHGRDLAGVRVLITAGGTQEPLDPIRFIGNRSSGKQGYAFAREAARRGAAVTLVTGPTALEDPAGVSVVKVRTAAEMLDAVLARYDDSEVVVKAAAVGDFRPANPAPEKIKKHTAAPTIELTATVDILRELGRIKAKQILVGFSAETQDHLAGARKKLAEKNLDLIIVNHVGGPDAGFEADTNMGVILGADGSEDELPLQLKSSVARVICDRVAALIRMRAEGT
jgi:phosphopantothenoylcysteine decarboxylase/phosphopantothenate--cysteine ligase